MTSTSSGGAALPGADWRRAMAGAAAYLELYRDAANALNVFPVPDGDTGTNMLLTLRAGIAALDAADASADDGVDAVAESVAGGAFWGARGNSGVILSQMLRGLADRLVGVDVAGAEDVAGALASATAAAYGAVSQPREGTMLSVIRGAAEAAGAVAGGGAIANGDVGGGGDAVASDAVAVWEAAYDGAVVALGRTPEQLAVLKEAGVVDSGGLGVVAIIGGALRYLRGDTGAASDLGLRNADGAAINPAHTGSVSIADDFLEAHDGEEFGYCTQFVIHGNGLAVETLRGGFDAIAQSTVIIGGGAAVRVHIHTENPGEALSYGIGYGALDEIKIDNMSLQNRDWASGHRERARPASIRAGAGVIAVAAGPGLAALFQDAGCAAIIPGGQTLNPSAGEIIEAAQQAGCRDVIVLPNNDNVILTAEQAAAATGAGNGDGDIALYVVATRSMPQGMAAMLGFNPEVSLLDNLANMEAAGRGVATLEVTPAVRDAAVNGRAVSEGQFMALLDGALAALGDTAEAALLAALPECAIADDSIVTLYWGEGSSANAAARVQERVESDYDGVHVDVYAGGQPHYPYLVSVE